MARTQIHLISYNFMGKHAFWMASFQCLAKSLPTSWILLKQLFLSPSWAIDSEPIQAQVIIGSFRNYWTRAPEN